MDSYQATFYVAFTPQILVALLCGALGTCITLDPKRYGYRLAVLIFVATIIGTGAMADYFVRYQNIVSLWFLGGLGIFGGMAIGLVIDALRVALPNFTKRIVNVAGDTIVDNGADMLNRVTGGRIKPIEPPPTPMPAPTPEPTNDSSPITDQPANPSTDSPK